jgi:rubrerythrin
MPDFGTPFKGLKLDRSLTKEELIKIMRFLISAEYEAVAMYSQVAEAIDMEDVCQGKFPDIRKVIRSVIDEERVHAGEFMKVLMALDPDEAKFYQKGFQEADELMGKQSISNLVRIMAKKVHEGEYVWQKTEKGDAKTLMYKSPFTKKKFHVSP